MPVSVIIGGQFGSEGKGKVSAFIAKASGASAVVRVGGPNSGHTAVDSRGNLVTLRQLPAAAVQSDAIVVLPAGSLIDAEILLQEIALLRLSPEKIRVDSNASIIKKIHVEEEVKSDLISRISSTASGTGAALSERVSRGPNHLLARDINALKEYTETGTASLLRKILDKKGRIVIEGTQGFGLSLWHSAHFPFVTSRDTTAASFVAEAGLAPHDVDDVVMVLRAFPIRVGGNSGPLPNEITWRDLAAEARLPSNFRELTSATRRPRRIGRFDSQVVLGAIASNNPNRIVMNHLDYVDPEGRNSDPTYKSYQFLTEVEELIGRDIDLIGFGPDVLLPRTQDAKGRSV